MTFEGLNISEFGFTEIQDNEIPYHVAGYAHAVCKDESIVNSYEYVPPTGWEVKSCVWMPDGTHGVPAGEPCRLIWCEPKEKIVAISESPGLFPNVGGVTGFVAAGLAAAALLVGYVMLAKKKN